MKDTPLTRFEIVMGLLTMFICLAGSCGWLQQR